MGGRLWKAKNFIRSAFYAVGTHAFKGNVPVISEHRSSWEDLLKFLLQNVIDTCYDQQKNLFRLPQGPQVSFQGVKSDAFELTLRPFIGLGFLARHSSSPAIEKIYLDVIRQGVDPKSKHFWGNLPTNQVLIENLSLLTGILLNPTKFWGMLTIAEKANLLDYVTRCESREFVDNNWLWSKVFHLLFLKIFSQRKEADVEIRDVMSRISEFYVADGWYRDGLDEAEFRYDHYNSWAMHYYGLLFCLLAGSEFEDIKAVLRERFLDFKRSYLLIFSRDHLPVAWGRSLIYRFGMLSCFGVALENNLLDADEIKEIKTIAVDTINNFFRRGILDEHGLLTMGYTQINKNILEEYSGVASPYWALKGFSFLMLDPKSDFWKVSLEHKVPVAQVAHLKSCGVTIQKYSDGHSMIINAGMSSRLYALKYNRFAYSNVFPLSFDQRCLDNSLMIFNGSQLKVFDLLEDVMAIDEGITFVRLRISSLPGIKAAANIVAVPNRYVVNIKIETKERLRYRIGGFCSNRFNVTSKAETVLNVYRSGHGNIGTHKVSPIQNTLGVRGEIKYFESFLESGNNELVFGVFASLSRKLLEPTYQEHEGKITIEADSFSKTFNQVIL